ncbi:hypothetical protein [Teichococcus aestuarii]|uniref:hypothetical protein n=1 Tax=Teichococcus aestuarii TaxID=568898 RepID=UPI0011B1E794|nr:hypothetical protein [Pseudoroseomonas aestuarii]
MTDKKDLSCAANWQQAAAMFLVSESNAAAIRLALEEGGEWRAAVELRRRFPGLASNAQAQGHVQTIAGWWRSNEQSGAEGTVALQGDQGEPTGAARGHWVIGESCIFT